MKPNRYGVEEKLWIKNHKPLLPKTRKRKSGTLYAGTLNDLAEICDNPRQGSDVYVGGEFMIVTIQTKQSRVEGAPRMPVKQWYRLKLGAGLR